MPHRNFDLVPDLEITLDTPIKEIFDKQTIIIFARTDELDKIKTLDDFLTYIYAKKKGDPSLIPGFASSNGNLKTYRELLQLYSLKEKWKKRHSVAEPEETQNVETVNLKDIILTSIVKDLNLFTDEYVKGELKKLGIKTIRDLALLYYRTNQFTTIRDLRLKDFCKPTLDNLFITRCPDLVKKALKATQEA